MGNLIQLSFLLVSTRDASSTLVCSNILQYCYQAKRNSKPTQVLIKEMAQWVKSICCASLET